METSTGQMQNDVFKFMVVRPPETIDEETESKRFIRVPDEIVKAEDFFSKIEKFSKSRDTSQLKSHAAAFINSASYVSGFRAENKTVSKLQEINKQIGSLEVLTIEAVVDIFETNLGKKLADVYESKEFVSNFKNLWKSLYAAFFNQNAAKHDKGEIIQMLRLCHVVGALVDNPGMDSVELAERFFAKSVITKDFATGLKGNVDKKDQTKPKQNGIDVSVGKIQDMLEELLTQVVTLEKAKVELEEVEEVSSSKKSKAESLGKTKILAKGSVADGSLALMSLGASLILDSSSGASFSAATKEVLKNVKIDFVGKSAGNVRSLIDKAIKNTYTRVYELGGVSAVNIVARSVNPVFSTQIAGLYDDSVNIMPVSNTTGIGDYDNSIFDSLGSVVPIGIGDLEIVKETLMKYDMGEIAYIENIMQSESKERVYRRLDRTEETYTTSTETESTEERDQQTTSRYDMQTETAKTIGEQAEASAGVSVSASYGPVSMSLSAEYSTSSSSSESSSTAVAYAKEITDSAISKIVEKVKEEQSTTTITEVEETSTHAFNNEEGDEHINGIYRWVDKYYQDQVYNYGQRLMFEFIVPEPASFYAYALDNKEVDSITAEKPEDLPEDFNAEWISDTNYYVYSAAYGASGIEPPPAQYEYISKAFSEAYTDGKRDLVTKEDNGMTVPDGYEAYYAYKRITASSDDDEIFMLVGNHSLGFDDSSVAMSAETGVIPVSIIGRNVWAYVMNVVIKCKRSNDKYTEWQISTYDKIVAAYNSLLDAYNSAVALAASTTTVNIEGHSSDTNRDIEQNELKKACITLLTNQHYAEFDAMEEGASSEGYPEVNVAEATLEGPYIQFFEQAFEWENMTYIFYPYFWGKKSRWVEVSQAEDSADPTFTQFLQAGAARVLVPVQSGSSYEEAVLHYIETGEIWNGGEVPTIDDPLYISIVDEIQASEDLDINNAVAIDEPWDVVLPTTLTMLQEESELPDWTEEGGYAGS